MNHEEFSAPRPARATRPRKSNHGGAAGALLAVAAVIVAVFLVMSIRAESVAVDQKCTALQQDVRALQDRLDRTEQALAKTGAEVLDVYGTVQEMKIMQGRIQIVLDRLHADWSNLE